MSCTTYFSGHTVVHRLDPRPRVVATLVFAVLIALSSHYRVLCAGVGVGVFLAMLSRLPIRPLARRLLRLNLFMVVLFLLVPTTSPGEPMFRILTVPFSYDGVHLAAGITLKANAIVLVFTSLLGTVELSSLGHAFHHLHVPAKLTHLFMFTLRYLDVLHHEYTTLLRAMKARAFRPGMTVHTYRTYGYLMGMLLVRSLERSERIMAAMKCRGFRGEFHAYSHFAFSARDVVFGFIALCAIGALALTEWIQGGRAW
ncbi:MAG: cobalt ECF transporter T component CbiQ [Verrucomicrobia bacterium]|nr:cobalt ECF transporter T component CbiQ [Verrucomicrobiota bacterium]